MDTAEKLIPGIDTKIVLDELYYTVKGAMKIWKSTHRPRPPK